MAIYDPVVSGAGIYSGGELGKDAPFYSPIRGYNIKVHGPGAGKVKAVIAAAQYGYRYFKRNPRFAARLGAVAGGALVSNYATNNKYRKTYGSAKFSRSSFRRNHTYNNRVCCCRTSRNSYRSKRR